MIQSIADLGVIKSAGQSLNLTALNAALKAGPMKDLHSAMQVNSEPWFVWKTALYK